MGWGWPGWSPDTPPRPRVPSESLPPKWLSITHETAPRCDLVRSPRGRDRWDYCRLPAPSGRPASTRRLCSGARSGTAAPREPHARAAAWKVRGPSGPSGSSGPLLEPRPDRGPRGNDHAPPAGSSGETPEDTRHSERASHAATRHRQLYQLHPVASHTVTRVGDFQENKQ